MESKSPAESCQEDSETASRIEVAYQLLLNMSDDVMNQLEAAVAAKEVSVRIAAERLHDLIAHHYGNADDRRKTLPRSMSVLDDVEQDWLYRFNPPLLEYLVGVMYAYAFKDLLNSTAHHAVQVLAKPLQSASIDLPGLAEVG
ncbi:MULTISPECIES: hypothetical protein [Corynebacterium]|uniref:hypothetical protein n=1 Tax=Corynebacterium TaxID=1716 RepID=UPI0011CC92D3|nr:MULTISPECIES: hypothetical protein [Corynebacterium]MDK7145164.1 hypothetical protein [Corynebacterium amycolatum]TXS81777.1 hypothetical protein CHU70_10950 [Corynebacterium sp. LK10]